MGSFVILVNVLLPLSSFIHTVAYASFSPQNYSVPEGTAAELKVVVTTPFCRDVTFTVTTTDGTATCEWKVLLLGTYTAANECLHSTCALQLPVTTVVALIMSLFQPMRQEPSF